MIINTADSFKTLNQQIKTINTIYQTSIKKEEMTENIFINI